MPAPITRSFIARFSQCLQTFQGTASNDEGERYFRFGRGIKSSQTSVTPSRRASSQDAAQHSADNLSSNRTADRAGGALGHGLGYGLPPSASRKDRLAEFRQPA